MKTKEIQNGIEVWVVNSEDREDKTISACRCCCFDCKKCQDDEIKCIPLERDDSRDVYFIKVKDGE